jgi:hypothetical protein
MALQIFNVSKKFNGDNNNNKKYNNNNNNTCINLL